MNSWLQDNDIEIYSTDNEGKSFVAERFIRALKNKIHKDLTSTSKNMYIDKLDDIVDKYNNIYHRTIRMKPINVNASTYFDFDVENNDKVLNFEVGDHVKISEHKINLA